MGKGVWVGEGESGKVCRDLSGECRDVGRGVGCGETCRVGVEECVGSPHTFPHNPKHFSTPPHIPTHFPQLPHNLYTHLIHSSTPPSYFLTSPTPPQHTSPFLPHILPLLQYSPILDPTLLTTKNSPIPPPSILSQILYTPSFTLNSFPYSSILALSLISYQNFSLCSFIAKFSLAIKKANTENS